MKKHFFTTILTFLVTSAFAQVGINTIAPSAQLDIRSSNQAAPSNTDGILIPKIDVFPAVNPTTAQNGMMVFLTTAVGVQPPGFYYWDSATSSWMAVAPAPSGWALSGNSGTVAGTNFIGTTDNQGLDFRTNNTIRGRFTSAGFLGIGTTAPNQQLELTGNFRMPATTATAGVIYAAGNRFIHNLSGTFIGTSAGNLASTSFANVGVGSNAMQNVTNGNFNTGVGHNSLSAVTSGFSNTALGYQSMLSLVGGGDNTSIGSSSLRSLTSGARNIAIGSQSMLGATTGSDNVAMGYGALTGAVTSNFNTAVGSSAMNATSTGTSNTAMGRGSMQLNTSGSRNTAIGYNTISAITTTNNNTALGFEAGRDATGSGNLFLGYQAGLNETGNDKLYLDNSNTTTPLVYGDFATNLLRVNGTLNINNAYSFPTADGAAGTSLTTNGAGVVTWSAPAAETDPNAWLKTGNAGTVSGTNFIGTTDAQALDIRTNNTIKTRITTKGQIETLNTGNSVFVGEGAGANDDLSNNINVFVGYQAGNANTTGNDNVALGYRTLQLTTTGSYNTALGSNVLRSNTTGFGNVGTGNSSLFFNTSGIYNTANGVHALNNNTTGNNNTAVGAQVLYTNSTGADNTAVGVQSLYFNSTGLFNTAVGTTSLRTNTTGVNNTGVGYHSLFSNVTGNNNTALGYNADVNSAGLTNATAIGYNAKVAASNSMVLGGTGADAINVGIGTTAPTEELEVVGDVRTSSLAGTGTRMVQADTNGTLTPLVAGTASQVLLGTGVWGSVPTDTAWSLTGNTGTVNGTNFIGTTDNQAIDFRTNNVITTRFTTKGQIETLNTGNSVFVGEGAGANDDLSDNRNVLIGLNAGQTSTTSNYNTGIGYQALQNSVSNGATAVGYKALQNYTGIRGTAVGYEALKLTTTGSSNTALGYAALSKNTTGGNNTAVGSEALLNVTTGNSNVGVGKYALLYTTTGVQNTGVGTSALFDNTTGINNTALGFQSLVNNSSGNNNVAIGINTLASNTTGSNNIGLGYGADVLSNALQNAIAIGLNAKVNASNSMVLGGTGVDAVKVGIGTTTPAKELEVVGEVRTSSLAGTGTRVVQADSNGTLTPLAAGTASQVLLGTGVWGTVPGLTNDWSTTGNSGTVAGTNFIGTTDNQAIDFRTNNIIKTRVTTKGQIETLNTGQSVFVGEEAGANDDLSNNNNVNIGYQAGKSNATGVRNVSVGYQALTNNTGNSNVGVGALSLTNNTTGNDNIAVGQSSLTSNTTGGSNVGMGTNSLSSNTTGASNTAIGTNTLVINNGSMNVAIGDKSMYNHNTGSYNTAVGGQSLFSHTTGGNNVAVGFSSLINNISGIQNTAVGFYAGQNATGSNNVFIGNRAGSNETGHNTLYIANSNTASPLIYGDFAAALLRVNGTLNVNNSYSFPTADGTAGQVLTTDGAGAVSWSNGAADNLGNHIAAQNVQLNNNFLSNDGDNEGVLVDNDGNVGVGIAPTAKLHVNGTAKIDAGSLFLNTDDNVDKIQLTNWGDAGSKINHSPNWSIDYKAGPADWDTTGSHTFYTSVNGVGYVERMRIFSDGNVGIGTTNPQERLHVSGNIRSSSLAGATTQMVQANTNGTLTPLAAGTASQVLLGTGVWGAVPGLTNYWSITGNAGTIAGTNFIGTTDNQAIDFRTNNIIKTRFTTKGQIETLNTGQSVFLGEGAGANDDLSSNVNAYVGYQAGNLSTTATDNAALGYRALQSTTTGSFNTAMGSNALRLNTTGFDNVAAGNSALNANTTGVNNTAVGAHAMNTNSTGSSNVAVGRIALNNNTSASNNTAVGARSLETTTTGGNNVATGYRALGGTTTGYDNSAQGSNSLTGNTTGAGNSALGTNALLTNTTGNNNTAIGYNADVTTAALTKATAIGYNAKVGASNSMALGGTGVDAVKVGIGTTTPAEELEVVGDVRTSSLAGVGTRMVQADANGTLTPLAAGTAAQVLLGTGVWGTVPAANAWNLTGNSGTTPGTDFIGTSDNQAFDFRTNNTIRARMSAAGFFGIGTTSPSAYLDVWGNNAGTTSALFRSGNNNNSFSSSQIAFGYSGTSSYMHAIKSRHMSGSDTGNAIDFTIWDYGTDAVGTIGTKTVMTIDGEGNGRVGIGTTTPSALFDVNGSAMLSNAAGNSDLQFNTLSRSTIYPNGTNTPVNVGIQLRSKGTAALELNSDNAGNVQMVTGGGNVGVGTTTPTQAKMVVNGTQNNTLSYGFLNSGGSTGTVVGGTAGFSIYASGRIAATEFNAFSDERIKNIKGISNSSKDLETLNQIQITDYTFKDSIAKGNGLSKKVIAQQLEKVYPQAVATITDVIPDIYTIAKIQDGRIILKNTLTKGDKVRLVFENKTEMVTVLQADEYGFNVDLKDQGKVFVYGREVKDFHTVDYEALSTLNISATQELLKIITEQESQIRALKADNAAMNDRVTKNETDINVIKGMLGVEANNSGQKK